MKFKAIAVVLMLTLVSAAYASEPSRPAGGDHGGDIVVFDIIDSIERDSSDAQSASGGGPHVVVFDGSDSVTVASRSQTQSASDCPEGERRGIGGACGGGGDIIVFDIVD